MINISDVEPVPQRDKQETNASLNGKNPDHTNSTRSHRRLRSLVNLSTLWANGQTLNIAFMSDLDADHRQKIIQAASQWLPYVNLDFDFVSGQQGDIRITTGNNKNSSAPGANALLRPPAMPTMNLGVNPDHEDFETIVIHEFGHALGALHEHLHPQANIPWDKPKVYEFYQYREMNPLTREQVQKHIFTPYNPSQVFYLAYDNTSIMHYPVPNTLTLGDWELPINRTISQKDKQLMQLLYPK